METSPTGRPDLDAVHKVWDARMAVEYASASVTAELLHVLLRLGASRRIISECYRMVDEELTHAERCRNVLLSAGGSEDDVDAPAGTLAMGGEPAWSLPFKVAMFVVRFFVCGECVAIDHFRAMRDSASVPIVRKALAVIERDEAGHWDFGRRALPELLGHCEPTEVAEGMDSIPRHTASLLAAYETMPEGDETSPAWGLLPGSRQGVVVRAALKNRLIPWFKQLV